ncbi:hypothetical protein NP493_945g00005 [Ridgeia piscesae]|uniref:Uncharacterized protein n=1 Tax=Ridgeia piscesae TaxID=27915 RepID=A0AAD9KL17_RIDPI|nr:hypothetical protein NP493_945g00005 [Ridgeia piscesae]
MLPAQGKKKHKKHKHYKKHSGSSSSSSSSSSSDDEKKKWKKEQKKLKKKMKKDKHMHGMVPPATANYPYGDAPGTYPGVPHVHPGPGVYMGENPVCGVQPGYTLPPPVGLSQGPPADARQLPPVGFPSPSGYPEQVPIGFVRPPAAGYPGQCPAGYPPQPGYPGGQCGGEGFRPQNPYPH